MLILREIKFVLVIISLLTVTMTFSSIIFAQGSSALKITKITVTPSPFKTGQALSFSVEVENPTSKATYSGFDIYFSVKEDGAYRSIVTTNSPRLNAGEKRVVKIAQTYNVSESFKNICFVFTPIDAPNEFGPNFPSCYEASCTYNPARKGSKLPNIPPIDPKWTPKEPKILYDPQMPPPEVPLK